LVLYLVSSATTHPERKLRGIKMRRTVLTVAAMVSLAAVVVVGEAAATPPKGAIKGRFSRGLFSGDTLSKHLKSSAVWCAWRGENVIVHVNLKNTSIEHVTASVKPRYFIRNGGEHGSGGFGKDYGFDGGEFRSLWIDAGKPKGVPKSSPLSKCAPYLFLIKSG
jgi:hypothetical protein